MDLANKSCVPCQEGGKALSAEQISTLNTHLDAWTVVDDHHLSKAYAFNDFAQALDFVNKVGEIAETQNHHPDLSFGWGKAQVIIYTHAVNGLHENDFILAAKIDRI